jgi:hypothetical protein
VNVVVWPVEVNMDFNRFRPSQANVVEVPCCVKFPFKSKLLRAVPNWVIWFAALNVFVVGCVMSDCPTLVACESRFPTASYP